MPSGFSIPEDIANLGLQNCGAERITAFSDADAPVSSKNAAETKFCYHKLRVAELRRNIWTFSVRRSVLRPIDSNTLLWVPPVYVVGTTYAQGVVVSYTDTLGITAYYRSKVASNTGNTPSSYGIYWENYFGPQYASLYDSTSDYLAGDLVYEQATPGTITGYIALMESDSSTSSDPIHTQTWDATVTYRVGAIVVVGTQNYISLIAVNYNLAPATNPTAWATTALTGSYQWVPITGTFHQFSIQYPIGSGPLEQSFTKNVFPLPYGFVREAPQDPTAGAVSLWGSPTNNMMTDYVIENGFIVTMETSGIVFRYAADIMDVTLYDPMFCNGLAARIAITVCEPLTQSAEKIGRNIKLYAGFMGEARSVNAIESGIQEPPMDDYIATRI